MKIETKSGLVESRDLTQAKDAATKSMDDALVAVALPAESKAEDAAETVHEDATSQSPRRAISRSGSFSPLKKRRPQRDHSAPAIHRISGHLEKKTKNMLRPWKGGYFFETKAHYLLYSYARKKNAGIAGGVDLSGDGTTIELCEESGLDNIKFYCLKVVGLSSDAHDETAGETREPRTIAVRTRRDGRRSDECSIHDWYDALTMTQAALRANPDLVMLPSDNADTAAEVDCEISAEESEEHAQVSYNAEHSSGIDALGSLETIDNDGAAKIACGDGHPLAALAHDHPERADRDSILAHVAADGHALQHAHESLRSDEHVRLLIFCCTCYVVQYCMPQYPSMKGNSCIQAE